MSPAKNQKGSTPVCKSSQKTRAMVAQSSEGEEAFSL